LVALTASKTQRSSVGSTIEAWRGHWIATVTGFQLEMVLPLPPDGSTFGVAYTDVDKRGEARTRWVGSLSPQRMMRIHQTGEADENDPQLFHTSKQAFTDLESWVTPGTRARLFDARGRLVADVNALYEEDERNTAFNPATSSLWDALVYRLVSALLRDRQGDQRDKPLFERVDGLHLPMSLLNDNSALEQSRRYLTDESDFVLGSFTSITGNGASGLLLFESNDGRAAAYAGSRLAQMLSLLTLVSVAVGGLLLLFATVLSFRIRRLSKRAAAAVSRDGRGTSFHPTNARDEIGELSRTLASLLGRTKHYTHYLEALSSRLSHELRTPLSVVKTSLENIDTETLDPDTQRLLLRAAGGVDQLGHIIRALVESTRLEQTVQRAQKVDIRLADFLSGAKARYQQVYPALQFKTRLDGAQTLHGSPELLQQALDKLVDNAASFTADKTVVLDITGYRRHDRERIRLAVTNTGAIAAGTDPGHVFDPMFSSRAAEDGGLHLGLGLYIVRMVAEAHGGEAKFQSDVNTVTVSMDVPANMH